MNKQDKQELLELVEIDKQHIINHLSTINLKVVNNEVSLLFSDGEVDESTIDQQTFVNLWELQYEPSLVKVEFIIERPNELNSNIKDLMENLINKITTRGWLDCPYSSLGNSKAVEDDYNCFKSINIVPKQNEIEIFLIGAIGYFS